MNQTEKIVQVIQAWLKLFNSDVVAAVPVYNAVDDVLECVASLLHHTPSNVPIIVIDDASPDKRVQKRLSAVDDPRFLYIRKSENKGFVDTANLIFVATQPRDVIIINSDVVFPANWLERLRVAAYRRSNIATATPFTNHGTIVSLPERNHPTGDLPNGMTLAEVDDRIRRHSLQLFPIIPTAIGHCMYIRRTALDVVGYFDEVFAPGYGEEVDFSQRAVLAGFSHVLADDLFVYHKGSRSFSAERERIQRNHESILNQRYPWYRQWASYAATDNDTPLAYAIERASAAITRYYIALDATCINGYITGTQKITQELIFALAKHRDDRVHLSIIVQDDISMEELHGLDTLVDAVIPVSELQTTSHPRFDLLHRNFQLRSLQDYTLLSKNSRRLIVSQLDFIAYGNPRYAESVEHWQKYRNVANWVMSVADGVVFISQDVADDAQHRGVFVSPERQCIIPPGVDHHFNAKNRAVSPRRFLPEKPFVLMLGTDFWHKNRLFGLKVLQQLVEQYQWDGLLVVAGSTVAQGSSRQAEKEYLTNHPNLKKRVIYLPPVSEAEKQWLLENTVLLLYPSTYEGFGIVPFEAAEVNTPALASRMTSLAEVLGDDIIALDSFNPTDGAMKAWQLITDDRIAAQQISAIKSRAKIYTWDIVAQKTWEFYRTILALPPRFNRRNLKYLLDEGFYKSLFVHGTTLPAWRRRLAMAFFTLFTQGVPPLWQEIRQYLQWVLKI